MIYPAVAIGCIVSIVALIYQLLLVNNMLMEKTDKLKVAEKRIKQLVQLKMTENFADIPIFMDAFRQSHDEDQKVKVALWQKIARLEECIEDAESNLSNIIVKLDGYRTIPLWSARPRLEDYIIALKEWAEKER